MTLALSAAAREMGDLLRKRRTKIKLSLKTVAERLGVSVPHLSRIETGDRSFRSETEIMHYLVACDTTLNEIKSIMEVCRGLLARRDHWVSPHSPWMVDSLQTLIFHESQATKTVGFEPDMIPGLMQTEAYARAIQSGRGPREWVEARVNERLARQRILFRNTKTKFSLYVHERALRLEVGSYQIMAEQLHTLLRCASQPNISLRVVPASLRHLSLFGGAFRLMGFNTYPTLAYLDAAMGGVFVENRDHTDCYVALNRELHKAALDPGQSRMFIARLADENDRQTGSWDDNEQVTRE